MKRDVFAGFHPALVDGERCRGWWAMHGEVATSGARRLRTAVVCLVVLCGALTASAQDGVPLDKPASREEFESKWLSNASCVKCHFHVPQQSEVDLPFLKRLVTKGYATNQGYLDAVKRHTKAQQCTNCHAAANVLHGECTRPAGCLRNAGKQKTVTYLGVSVGAVPRAVRQHVKLPHGVGLMIESVEPDSPAAKAELRTYDILRRLDSQLLVNQEQFSVLIKAYRPGDEISIELVRANESKTISVSLGERLVDETSATEIARLEAAQLAVLEATDALIAEGQLARAHADVAAATSTAEPKSPSSEAALVTYLGVNTSSVPSALAEQLALPNGLYLVLDSVENGSPAEAAGLRPFDVLEKLDDQLLVNSEQLTVLIRNRRPGDEVELSLIRDGQPLKVRARLGEHRLSGADIGQGTVIGDYDSDGRLDLSTADFHLVDDKLSMAVDLSVSGGNVKDEDFVRRIYLDLAGSPPSAKEIADFSADTWPNKRQRLVERLLSRPDVIGKIGGTAVLHWSDNEHSLVLSSNESGEKRLLVRDKEGDVVFDGPVSTDGQRRELDPRLAPKLDLMLRGLAAAPRLDHLADAATALEKTLARFHADKATLDEMFELLRRETGANIVIDRKALTAAGVAFDEPLSLDLHDVRARSVLKTIVALAAGAKSPITYEVDDGVVLVTVAR